MKHIPPVTDPLTVDRVHLSEEHVYSESKVYSTLANGVAVAIDATVWTLGSFVEIVPASTIGETFDTITINPSKQ